MLTKTTAAKNGVALSYRVRGLYFLAVIFVRSVDTLTKTPKSTHTPTHLHTQQYPYPHTY